MTGLLTKRRWLATQMQWTRIEEHLVEVVSDLTGDKQYMYILSPALSLS